MNKVDIADFPFCFNIFPIVDSLLETNETFKVNLETTDDVIVLNPSSATFTIIDSVRFCQITSLKYTGNKIFSSLQTEPTVAVVELTVTEIRDIISESNRTENDLEIIAGSLEGVVHAVSMNISISENVSNVAVLELYFYNTL